MNLLSASSSSSFLFSSPTLIFSLAFALRLVLLLYGIYHDAHSALKYTDIDYYVFTDAARAVSRGGSPYDRATYRYTPLLAWILLPTAWSDRNGWWFHSGKALFALSDLVAGWLILVLLRKEASARSERTGRKQPEAGGGSELKYAAVWLLNPMVANISTRGSSEGLLCVLVMGALWAFETQRVGVAGVLLGLCVHFKIYPFVYGVSMLWALGGIGELGEKGEDGNVLLLLLLLLPLRWSKKVVQKLFGGRAQLTLIGTSVATFVALNVLMYAIYGRAFFEHTFLYHLTRTDHRHNFSPYHTLLYLSSSRVQTTTTTSPPFNSSSPGSLVQSSISFERLAFLPQLLLSTIFIPISCAGKTTSSSSPSPSSSSSPSSLAPTLLAQTLAFVTFNKVCTSQYFLWYLIFLPLYLPHSSLLSRRPRRGLIALALWIATQALWLYQGFQLEFWGRSTFVPGLWMAGMSFFAVNCWILGVVVGDVVAVAGGDGAERSRGAGEKTGERKGG